LWKPGVKKLNKTLYTLMFATSSTLLPYGTAHAEDKSQWECTPSADFRSWICLKDGKAPEEEITKPVASKPEKTSQPGGVTVTPLAAPEPIQPAKTMDTVQPSAGEATTAPVAVTPSAPPPPEPISEPQPAMVTTPKSRPEPVSDAVETQTESAFEPAAGEPMVETSDTVQPPQEEPELVTEPTPAQEQALPAEKLSDKYAPIESPLVSVDESLRSCVAINRPVDVDGQNRQKLRESSPIEIEADEAHIEKDKQTVLSGNVNITRADQSLQSEKVVLDKVTNQADAAGKISYTDSQIQIKSEQAHLDFNKDENSFAEASFITLDRYSRGSAGQIQTQQGTKVKLDKVNYTTCPPGSNAWQLEAEEITLDDTSGRGEARDVKLEFFDVPVMYLPYMTFPIDDRRKSGLLTLRFGHSDDRGTELTTPIYWNIAPDRDATFYPRYMTERGLQLGGEYRYLNKTNYGQVNLEYLVDDDKYIGSGDNDRWGFKYEHDGTIFDNWTIGTRIRRVSDEQYFEDLGSSLSLSSTTHLHNYLTLSRASNNWSAHGLLQGFQTVDETIADADEPYKYLPYLSFNYWTEPFAGHFTADIKTTHTSFDHRSSAKVAGDRTTLYPSITYNYDKGGYYIRPKFGVHYTKYSLDNEGTLPSSPDRSVPIFSVDSGLFYEKDTTLFGQSMLQTLEPRIYYLKVAEKNQTRIPVFDSSLYDFSSSFLFRENRYSGLDRIGDTNQASVALTSRLLDNSDGSEKVSATLGQIYYFSDRDVTLPGETPDDDSSSPIIAELSYHPYRELIASAQLHWDPERSKTERQLYRMKYQPEDDKIINLAYRYREDFLKQTDVSFLWPLDERKRWHAIVRWNYSLEHDQTLDAFGGLEYESCCWKTRFVARRWVNDVNSDYDTGIFFELELKGLGSFGDDITSFLETGILGYDRHINEKDDDTYYY